MTWAKTDDWVEGAQDSLMAVVDAMQAAARAYNPPGKVARFLVERLSKAEGERVSLKQLLTAYHVWCDELCLRALSAEDFINELKSVIAKTAIAIQKDGDMVYCVDVKV